MPKASKKNTKKSRKITQMKYSKAAIFVFCLAALFTAVYYALLSSSSNTQIDPSIDAATRAKWAQPLELPGLPNAYKVSDDLYRGAQPTSEGMKQLEELGVKTVVNLRAFFSDRDELEDTGLAYEYIKTTSWNLENKDVVRFLQIFTNNDSTPIFVHCKHGSDRTGIMCAIYRIVIEGWSREDAIEEMTKGGFGYHSIWSNLPRYIRKLDIEKIKQQVGLQE